MVSVVVLSLGLILWGLSQRKETTAPSIEQKSSPYPVKIEGLSYSTYDYDKDRLIARIKADEFKVNPRRFWIFNVRPFNEATLINAILEIYLYEDMPSEVNLFSFAQEFLSLNKEGKSALKGMGLITRGVIKGLTLMVYKADKLFLVVKAKEAYIDLKRKETRLVTVSIEDVLSKKLITSRSVVWDNKEKVFKIPGEYRAQTPKGQASGKGIKVDLDFVVSLLKPQAPQVPLNKENR